jgi:hypothetical protein
MIDSIAALPAPLRHLLLAVATVLLTWGTTDAVPWLQGQTGYGALVGGLLAAFLAIVTPLVTSYGVGARAARQVGRR